MCKIAVMPQIKKGKEPIAWKIALALAPYLTKDDDDGFGYMALGDKGLFGERWLHVSQAFKLRYYSGKLEKNLAKQYGETLNQEDSYNVFGNVSDRIYSMALHARKATCNVSLPNVHPFVNKDNTFGIIHNGIISNASTHGVDKDGCDSEAILTLAEKAKAFTDITKWQDVADDLRGWWAVASYSYDAEKTTWWLDVMRDDSAKLYAMFVKELDSFVFCTSDAVLRAAIRKAELTIGKVYAVSDCVVMRHNATTGELVSTMDIATSKYGYSGSGGSGYNHWNRHYVGDEDTSVSQLPEPTGYRETNSDDGPALEAEIDLAVDEFMRSNGVGAV